MEIDFSDRKMRYLCCPPSWPRLRYLGGSRDLGWRCSCPSELIDEGPRSNWRVCDGSLDSVHIVLAKKFNRVVWFGFERRLFDGFVVCDGKCGERGVIYVQERGEKGMTFILVRSRFSGSLMSPVTSFLQEQQMTYIRARRVATAIDMNGKWRHDLRWQWHT